MNSKIKINGEGLGVKLRTSTMLSAFLAATVVVGAASPAFAAIVNTATVSGEAPGGDPVDAADDITDTDSETVAVETSAPSFTVEKSVATITTANGADASNPDGGDTITFQYIVANTGNVTLDGSTVSITDPGPTFDGSAATNALGTITLTASTDVQPDGSPGADGVLSPGEEWTYTAVYNLDQADVDNAAGVTDGVSNTVTAATADTSLGDPVPLDVPGSTLTAEDTITSNPSLTLDKIATRDGSTPDDGTTTPYAAGDVITYVFNVENEGNVTISGITVTDDAASFGGVGTLSAVVCTTSGDETIASMAPGATESCTATYTVQEGDL